MAKLPKNISALIDEITTNDYEIQKKSKKIKLGSMALFYYPSPKYAATLDVYDILPYVFILGGTGKHIWGLNVHYFSWSQRLKFMKYINSINGNLKYKDIKKAFQAGQIPLGLAQYCYRMYLISHIASNVRIFNITDNEDFKDAYVVAQKVLPKFKGKSDSDVYKSINKKFKKHRNKK